MNILSFSTCPLDPTLGSGKTRLRWSEGLRMQGHSVEILEPRDFEKWRGGKRALRFRQAWGAFRLIEEKVKAGGYDLVEFFGGEFGLATWRLSKIPGRPLIVAHTDGLELLASERERAYNRPVGLIGAFRSGLMRATHEQLSRAAFDYSDAFVTGCELDREVVLRLGLYPQHRTSVVEPGLDAEYLSMPFMEQKEARVAYLGSWIPRKDVGVLSAVMGRVLTMRPQLTFDVYGTGGARDAVLTLFPRELRERVIVHPRLTNQEIAEGLGRAKVFFFPSQYEGFGMALAEAMACSCAPVTTPTGFGAALRDGEEALVTGFGDADAMRQAILSLLDDEGLRRRIAQRAWERVRPLSWDANISKLAARYEEWTAQHRQTSANVTASDRGALPLEI